VNILETVKPRLGEGIYLVKDVAKILRLDYQKTYRWIVGYWGHLDSSLEAGIDYTFGDSGNRAINFYSLIEFYTFFKLREKGLSSTEIRELHHELSSVYNTQYPFAIAHDFFVDERKSKGLELYRKPRKKFVYYTYLENLVKRDKRYQFSLKFVEKFLEKVEFDDNNLAVRFFPLANSRNVVVDPKRQFGQPIVSGTNIKTQTIIGLYNGGESVENISNLYNISVDKVQDAIAFQKAA
jgi:uncharacterized protein (DUF433 family)